MCCDAAVAHAFVCACVCRCVMACVFDYFQRLYEILVHTCWGVPPSSRLNPFAEGENAHHYHHYYFEEQGEGKGAPEEGGCWKNLAKFQIKHQKQFFQNQQRQSRKCCFCVCVYVHLEE